MVKDLFSISGRRHEVKISCKKADEGHLIRSIQFEPRYAAKNLSPVLFRPVSAPNSFSVIAQLENTNCVSHKPTG
jgi:hypothetical protein